MEKISRYILVFMAILTLSILLPKIYWMAFETKTRKPFVQYSCINHDFMIHRGEEGVWVDTKGNQYTREEYEQKLPVMFFKQLITAGTMPDSVNGEELSMQAISKSKSFFRLKTNDVDAPAPSLFPLFESRSGRAMLELPNDFFRITWRIEFIDVETNTILEEKSQLFSAALYHYGFSFPAKIISGLPTPRKSVDEGYLLVDSKDQLFHLKMIKGNPYVKQVEVPEGLKFSKITCVDNKDTKYYAYLFSDKNEIYILTQNDYSLIKWPVEGFELSNCDLRIFGDLFNYTVIIEAEDRVRVIALSPDYKFVDSYTETWETKNERREGKMFSALFPAQISMTSESSKFIRFYFSPSIGYYWVCVNLFLTAIHILGLYFRREKVKNHLLDLGIVFICGVYGFIAVNIFQKKTLKSV